MEEYFLQVRGVSKSFQGVNALSNVNFNLKAGEAKCLVGENGCGKSTLIKIISGVYTADCGEIIINGKTYRSLTPTQSISEGIQVIYQDFSLFPNLTVAENIATGYQLYHKNKWVNKKINRELAAKVVQEIGVPLDLDMEVGALSVGEKQVVAICRALLLDAKLVIMDEPTTALTSKEIDSLYKIIGDLKKRGIALIFVSHKLDEVFAVAESVCVLRNGCNVIDGQKEAFDKSKMTYYMTGREIISAPYLPLKIGSKPMFEVKNYTLPPHFQSLNFRLYQGEILGITGLLGSGRTELAEAIFGLRKPESGSLMMDGALLKIKESYDAVNAGIGYLPEDRLTQGLFLNVSIERNITAGIVRKFSQRVFNFIDKKGMNTEAARQVDSLNIKSGNIQNAVMSLSGGNQQRVVLAKWLAIKPKILILNCPTVGVDVGSKSSIHETIKLLAGEGIGVIVISDDLPEILTLCSRILVMNKGSFTGEYKPTEIDEPTLQLQLAKA